MRCSRPVHGQTAQLSWKEHLRLLSFVLSLLRVWLTIASSIPFDQNQGDVHLRKSTYFESISPLIHGDKLWWRFCVCFLSVIFFFLYSQASKLELAYPYHAGVPCSMLYEILCICLRPRPSSYLSLLPTWCRVGEADESAVGFLLWWHVLSSQVHFEKQQNLLLTWHISKHLSWNLVEG